MPTLSIVRPEQMAAPARDLTAFAAAAAATEGAIVGALMAVDRDAAVAGLQMLRDEGVTPSHFADPLLARLYATAGGLLDDGAEADPVAVWRAAVEAGTAEASDLSLVSELAATGTLSGLPNHARALVSQARQRAAMRAADNLRARLAEPGADIDAVLQLARTDLAEAAAAGGLRLAPLAIAAAGEPDAQAWAWERRIPAGGHVTLLAAHGGTGKTTIAVMLAVAAAAGTALFGHATPQTTVVFYSAEEPASRMRTLVRRACDALGVAVEDIEPRLHAIDASDVDPVLFAERREAGVRTGMATPMAAALARYIQRVGAGLVIVDNMSDTFDGDEIARPLVRAFIRTLAGLVRPTGGALVLLAHIDKQSSRAGKAAGSETYSGSTAVHNSVRSRLALLDIEPSLIELRHEKSNLGQKAPVLRLHWPVGGLPEIDADTGVATQRLRDEADLRTLLRLVADAYAAGQYCGPSLQSPANVHRQLRSNADYPARRDAAATDALLRQGQRRGLVEVEEYRTTDRKTRTRWAVTPAGQAFIRQGQIG